MPNAVAPFTPLHGVDQQCFCTLETTFDTAVAWTSAMAFGAIELDFEDDENYDEIRETAGQAGVQSEAKGLRMGKWSCKVNCKTNGAGVTLNYAAILQAALGTQTVTGGTSVQYVFNDTLTVPQSLQLGKIAGQGWYEQANGCIVEKYEEGLDQGGKAAWIKFSGAYASYARLQGNPQTNASTYTSTTTAITIAATSVNKIVTRGNAQVSIAFGTENNGGLGYRATIDSTHLILTITPGLVNGIGASQNIIAFTPTWANAGTVVAGINASISLAGTAVNLIGYSLEVDTGYKLAAKESSVTRPRFAHRGKRAVKFKATFYVLDENVGLTGTAWSESLTGTTQSVAIRVGPNTAGQRATTTTPVARFKPNKVKLSDTEAATYQIESIARINTGSDEFNRIWN